MNRYLFPLIIAVHIMIIICLLVVLTAGDWVLGRLDADAPTHTASVSEFQTHRHDSL